MVNNFFGLTNNFSKAPRTVKRSNYIENRPYLCSWYCIGSQTTCSLGLISFAFEKTPCVSLGWKLLVVSVQYQEYKKGLLNECKFLHYQRMSHQTYWENSNRKCVSDHCSPGQRLAINWPVLSQSQWSNFCSHMINSLILVLCSNFKRSSHFIKACRTKLDVQ